MHIKSHLLGYFCRDIVVTWIENHWIIHLFNIIEILKTFKIFKYHWIGKCINNINLRKLDFLSEEQISERSRFVLPYSPIIMWLYPIYSYLGPSFFLDIFLHSSFLLIISWLKSLLQIKVIYFTLPTSIRDTKKLST